jgi:hypothetical protein
MESSSARIRLRWLFLTVAVLVCIGIGGANSGCATSPSMPNQQEFFIKMEGNPAEQKSIFVFLDGTGNDERANTNIWRLFEQVKVHKNPQTVGRYILGVGSVNEPLQDDPMFAIFGDALGRGMQARILAGYDFIVNNYKPGDEIFIFGYSRGAHQARALAGLLAYAGTPKAIEDNSDGRMSKFGRILKLLKGKRDEDFREYWEAWRPNQAPLLAQEIKSDKSLNLEMQPVEIKFLGVWDTVPGSSFKNYDACIERIGFWKRYFHLFPMISKGERYKSGSYPPIHHIVHAVSLDEKRSKFAPLYLCTPITPQYTAVNEMWFPGAHADVGGGYGDHDLPNLSLKWMIDLLNKSYRFASPPHDFIGNATGLAHWSYGDKPANKRSDCEDRKENKDRQPPLGYTPHPSVDERTHAGMAPILVKGVRSDRDWRYPILCPGPGK